MTMPPAGRRATCAAIVLFIGVVAGERAPAGTLPTTDCPNFPENSWWRADISALPKHARSGQWMARMSQTRKLHPDFGPSYGAQPAPYGIPITYVNGSHAKVPVRFEYASESDRVRYPLGADTKVEGGQWTSGDRHTIVVDRATCRLYDTWATQRPSGGQGWRAGSGATWYLTSNRLRPLNWTSADAAGLSVLAGLLRFDEVQRRRIDHAIRSDTKAILEAMKKYGLVLADNGSPWYFQGTADNRWPAALLDELKQIPAAQFEAVDTSSLMINVNSMKVKAQP
jgi:hypothetical protein